MKFVKELWNSIVSLWNVWGGFILSLLIGKAVNFEKLRMDTAVSYILLLLAIMSALTIIKKNVFRKKISKIEALALMTQKTVSNIDTSIDPLGKMETLGNNIIETKKITRKVGILIMTKIKTILKWLGNYWQQWIGLLGTYVVACYVYYCIAMDKLNWLFENWLPQEQSWILTAKIIVAIIVALGVALVTRNQCKWVGLGSNEKVKEYKEALQNLTNEAIPQLSSSAKATIRSTLKEKQSSLKLLEANLSSVQKQAKQLENDIKDKQTLFSIIQVAGATETMINLQQKYQETVNQITTLGNEIEVINNDIENLTNALQ